MRVRITFHLTLGGRVSPVPFTSRAVAEQVRDYLAAGGWPVGITTIHQ